MTEQQQHLEMMIKQRATLAQELESLNSTVASKRDMFLKTQGVIEYLTQIGVTLPQESKEDQLNIPISNTEVVTEQ
jgi:hypothetical protein